MTCCMAVIVRELVEGCHKDLHTALNFPFDAVAVACWCAYNNACSIATGSSNLLLSF